MTTGTAKWAPVTKARPCEACGKPDYCTRTVDGVLVKCMRCASDRSIRQKDGTTAYIHAVGSLGRAVLPITSVANPPVRLTRAEIELMLRRNRTALTDARLAQAAAELKVSAKSLLAYGAGYDADRRCLSFPMHNAELKAIGVHLRFPAQRVSAGGKGKMCVRGSRNGLFVAADYDDSPLPAGLVDDDAGPLLLLTPEGLTDCCAAFDAGYRAIGRPSNTGGAELLAELLRRPKAGKQDVVVMGEREETRHLPTGEPYWPGIEGALSLCDFLMRSKACGRLRFVIPPEGRGKDLREWLTTHNAPAAELWCAIKEAKDVTPGWMARASRRLADRKAKERKPAAA